jgi:hypothetical protein
MKFHTAGTFETEALIDIAMRLVARLQDAHVPGIGGISVTLTPLDKKGAPCPLLLDGAAIERMEIDCRDIARPEADPVLEIGDPDRRKARGPSRKHRPRS